MSSGSDGASVSSGVDDIRYVLLVTIIRCIAFICQPFAMNSAASQSSKAGWEGRAPALPKVSGDATILRPQGAKQKMIHRDPGGQRVVGTSDPARKGQPPAGAHRRIILSRARLV